MPQPQSLNASTDYYAALLWLMGELQQVRAGAALRSFHERFNGLIPAEHYELNKSGHIKWEYYVYWARQALVNMGLMGSGGHGIWIITAVGKAWLETYPDGGGDALKQRLRQQRAAQSATANAPLPSQTYTTTLDGQTFTFTTHDVLTEIRAALANGVPQEARRFKNWHIVVDGHPLAVKWVIALCTGLPLRRFQSQQARQILEALGLSPQTRTVPKSTPAPQTATVPEVELTRSEFLDTVLASLTDKLPVGIRIQEKNIPNNVRQLSCPAPRSHYELRLGKRYTELGLHFEGKPEINLQLLDQMRLRLDRLREHYEETLHAESWGKHRTRVYLEYPLSPYTPATARKLAEDWLRFVNATLPLLKEALASLGVTQKTGKRPKVDAKEIETLTEILERELRVIRAYLNGDHTLAPSDEKLCDWVQFCYNFELFEEGSGIFKLIRPTEVNAWLYERARKLARICELRLGDDRADT
ncbi:MAG: winged helix-turn-helix domain-containing protein [Anaerolineae bacterium]|nr:winged helix-turn-helix domain-containing protein [Anaerolineae bacterium]